MESDARIAPPHPDEAWLGRGAMALLGRADAAREAVREVLAPASRSPEAAPGADAAAPGGRAALAAALLRAVSARAARRDREEGAGPPTGRAEEARRRLAALRPSEREVLVLHHVLALAPAELAEALGLSAEAAAERLARAEGRLGPGVAVACAGDDAEGGAPGDHPGASLPAGRRGAEGAGRGGAGRVAGSGQPGAGRGPGLVIVGLLVAGVGLGGFWLGRRGTEAPAPTASAVGGASAAPPPALAAAGEARPAFDDDPALDAEALPAMGELVARVPGETTDRDGAVRIASHRLAIRAVGPIARVEVEEVLENTTDRVLEGIYRIPLPPDATLDRLALDVAGKLEEAAFVDRDRAAAIWRGAITAPQRPREEVIWVAGPWKDPALLEWQRGGRFELRVFPIPARGSRRVVLAWSVLAPRHGGERRLVHALPRDPDGSTRVGRFTADIEVRDHEAGAEVAVTGYPAVERAADPRTGSEGVRRFEYTAEQFQPSGDLTVRWTPRGGDADLSAWAHRADGAEGALGSPRNRAEEAAPRRAAAAGAAAGSTTVPVQVAGRYLAALVRPRFSGGEAARRRSYAVVVDVSRSMLGEAGVRARALAVRLVRELREGETVQVLACDLECRTWPAGELAGGAAAAEEAGRFLSGEEAQGASDPVAGVASAVQALRASPGTRRIVFIGDGAATAGPTRPATVVPLVERAVAGTDATVTAVALGQDSDVETLAAMARGGGGVLVPWVPGRRTGSVVGAVLAATRGAVLHHVSVELPPGLSAIAPRALDAVPEGGEFMVAARAEGDAVKGEVVVRGVVEGQPFEQRLPLEVEVTAGAGRSFVPRLWAAARIRDLEREGTEGARREAVSLSSVFDVASRHTSLLVLESQAMFRAFGLDNQRALEDWTGETEADAATAGREEPAKAEGPGSPPATATAAPAPASRGIISDYGGSGGASRPAPAKPAARNPWPGDDDFGDGGRMAPPMLPRRRPMRRVFERVGSVFPDRDTPAGASATALGDAEAALGRDDSRRQNVARLHTVLSRRAELERLGPVVDRWLQKEPLDPQALTAAADLAARGGDRERALRLLGSVLDVRPGDAGAQRRLARLYRWAGRPELGCRFSLALAEARVADAKDLAEAVRCARTHLPGEVAQRLLEAASPAVRREAEREEAKAPADELAGDLRVEARWDEPVDLDLGLVHPLGHRVSWLGAPTREVISARDVVSTRAEALALRGAAPGEYLLEIARAGSREGGGPVSGEVTVTVAGVVRRIPFRLTGARTTLAVVGITTRATWRPF